MSTSFAISDINHEMLDRFRTVADPVADQTIQKIISFGETGLVNQVMMKLLQNQSFEKGMFSSLGDELSSNLDTYIEATESLPRWANPKQIKQGEQLFSLYGPEIFMLLNVSSLPLCYTCAKGAKVLYDTGRLLSHNGNIDPLARRLMETAQMVVNVLSEGGLGKYGNGIVTLQKVRLIHASIRYYLKNKEHHGQEWDVGKYGEPINQEDLAGTLMSFGPVIISGLKRLNIELSQDQIASYMHCWKVIGYLMGIDDRLLPDSYEDGFDLATKILKHQSAESESGKALTASCIAFMNYLTPGNAFDDVPAYFIDYFLEDFEKSSGIDLSKCIGLSDRADKKDKILLGIAKLIAGNISHLEEHKFIRKITSYFNKKLLNGIIHHFNDGKGVHFYIPPGLQSNWGLTDDWENIIKTPTILRGRVAVQKKIK